MFSSAEGEMTYGVSLIGYNTAGNKTPNKRLRGWGNEQKIFTTIELLDTKKENSDNMSVINYTKT